MLLSVHPFGQSISTMKIMMVYIWFDSRLMNLAKIVHRLNPVPHRSVYTNMAKSLIGVCQMRSTEDKDRNFAICESLVKRAHEKGAKVGHHRAI